MKAIICIGCSASGKSFWAKSQQDKNTVVIERDNIREDICVGNNFVYNRKTDNLWKFWKFKFENDVTSRQWELINECADKHKDIIISDTNLNISRREEMGEKLKQLGYQVEYKVFGEELTVDELWKRDTYRKNTVGHSVIQKQYIQFRQQFPLYTIKDTTGKPKAIIYDIDGTIASMVNRSPYDWDKVGQDIPNDVLFSGILGQHMAGYNIIFMSGRDEVCRPQTTVWLDDEFKKYGTIPYQLFMRHHGDMRKDTIVKHELFMNHVDGNYQVVGVYDDRPSVTRLWYDLGFRVYHCANPWNEF